MEKKFIVPAVSFLSGVAIWIVFFVLHLTGNLFQALLLNAGLSLLAGGLILFSGIRCKKAGGPRMGSVIRASVLFVLALLTCWKVGVIEAVILLVASLVLVVLTTAAPDKPMKER
jgi:chromate transport protein ChrA